MTSTFAIDVIQNLQDQEVEDFKAFLDSPFFNKGYNAELVKPFFEVLLLAIQKNEIELIEKEDIHKKLFAEKPYIESKIDKLMSELKRLLERFLLTQRYFSPANEMTQLLDLSAEMRQRGLESRHQQTLEKVKKQLDAPGRMSLKNLRNQYLLSVEEQEWQSTYNKGKGDLNILDSIARLDSYYYAHRTWMMNHLMFMQKTALIDDSTKILGVNSWAIPLNILEQSVFVEICWDVHKLLKTQQYEEADFYGLLKKIQANEQILSSESLMEFYSFLRNFCVILTDVGLSYLPFVLHEIQKDNLQRGYFYLDGKLSPNSYLSISQTALNVGAISWLSEFVEEHKDIIVNDNESRDFYKMNKALSLFGEKKYEEALEMIPFGSTYSAYHLMARRLELKIYYELKSELLEHKIDAFKMFISRAGRKVFSANLHELYTNFVNFVRQLSQSQGPDAKKRSVVLTKRIAEKKMVAERIWLLEKAKELGEKKKG